MSCRIASQPCTTAKTNATHLFLTLKTSGMSGMECHILQCNFLKAESESICFKKYPTDITERSPIPIFQLTHPLSRTAVSSASIDIPQPCSFLCISKSEHASDLGFIMSSSNVVGLASSHNISELSTLENGLST